ncbi:MAG: bile acid:sodium symporter [Waterburya sp.]
MDNPILLNLVKNLVTITIFTLMLAIGVNLSWEKLLSFWRRPGLLLRALLAVVVLVPLVVIILLRLFNLPPGVATGLALLAAAPGAPLTTKRSQMAGSKIPHAASLQLTLALLAVLITPITLAIFHSLFELETERVMVSQVFQQVARVQLLPVILGLLVQKFGPKIASVIAKPLMLIANSLFLLLVILLIVPGFRLILQIGILPLVAIVVMVIISLAIGHLLGGAEVDKRSALAISCIARNIGLALFIAVLSDAQKQVIPTLASYAILGTIVALPYSSWSKRQVARLKPTDTS